MERVLVFSHTTGYQLRAFNDAAEALGVELRFATDRCHKLDDPWQDRAVPVRFHDPETSIATIVRLAQEFPVHGVIAVGDRPVILAARAAEALGIAWHSLAGALASADKRRSRAALAAAGLPSPPFAVLTLGDARGEHYRPDAAGAETPLLDPRAPLSPLPFPVVLKPVGLSGSRGVIRANDAAEFAAAFARIRALLARPDVRAARSGLEEQILVEAYIDGREFAVEGVLTRGVLRVFAVFDKPDPLEGPFFEETIYVTPSPVPADVHARIAARVGAAAAALGLAHGPIHAECRVTAAGDVYVLEVAARPIGGLCSRVLSFTRPGIPSASLETILLEHALGRPIDGYVRERAAAAVMMIPIPRRGVYKGVAGHDGAREIAGVTDIRITAKEGQLLEPLPEAGSYLGFIFARGATSRDAEGSVRAAHQRLEFTIGRELAVTQPGPGSDRDGGESRK